MFQWFVFIQLSLLSVTEGFRIVLERAVDIDDGDLVVLLDYNIRAKVEVGLGYRTVRTTPKRVAWTRRSTILLCLARI